MKGHFTSPNSYIIYNIFRAVLSPLFIFHTWPRHILTQDGVHSIAVERILCRFNCPLLTQWFYLVVYIFKKVKYRNTLVRSLSRWSLTLHLAVSMSVRSLGEKGPVDMRISDYWGSTTFPSPIHGQFVQIHLGSRCGVRRLRWQHYQCCESSFSAGLVGTGCVHMCDSV